MLSTIRQPRRVSAVTSPSVSFTSARTYSSATGSVPRAVATDCVILSISIGDSLVRSAFCADSWIAIVSSTSVSSLFLILIFCFMIKCLDVLIEFAVERVARHCRDVA